MTYRAPVSEMRFLLDRLDRARGRFVPLEDGRFVALTYRLQNSGAAAVLTNAQGVAKLAEIRAQVPGVRCVLSIDGKGEGALSL